MMPKRVLVLAALLLPAAAAPDPLTALLEKLTAYLLSLPQEKVYVHTDKSLYALGESVWLKAYLADGYNHSIDTISKVVYLDFIRREDGKTLLQKRLRPTADGSAAADLMLADTLREGFYQIRAYTNWMRNFSPDFFFTKTIRVYQPTAEHTPQQAPESLQVDFFPESGDLVAGLNGRVGFKALDQWGKGVGIEGFVIEDARDTVAVFQSSHAGMGRFMLTPRAGSRYVAHYKGRASAGQAALPAVQPKGYNLTVDNLVSKTAVKVYVFNNSPDAANPQDLFLIGHLRGQVCFTAKGSSGRKSFVANVPRESFVGSGIAAFTLLTADGTPLAERLIFVQKPEEALHVSLTPDKPAYQPREKVTITVAVTDAAGRPVAGDFSLSATDATRIEPQPFSANILTHLLLQSDLPGDIEDPGYYFDPANADALLHLDDLLLTQGWRRFRWQAVMKEPLPTPAYLLEQGLDFTGKATRPSGRVIDKKPVSLTLMLSQPDKEPLFAMEPTDAEGRFGFYNLDFQDSARVMIQALAGRADRNLKLELDPKPVPATSPYRVPFGGVTVTGDFLKTARETYEREKQYRLDNVTVLKETVVKAQRTPERDPRKIYGSADASVKFDQLMASGATSIFQILQGRIAGLTISGSGLNYTVQIRGAANFQGVVEPLFLLDGMPASKDLIAGIPPMDVDYVDVLKGASAAIYGSQGGGGVIAIYTKRGNSNYDWSKEVIPGQVIRNVIGYARVREFYAPDYSTRRPEHVRPDTRTTLYWNPGVRTDASGRATVSFYHADLRGPVHLQLEGRQLSTGLPAVGRGQYISQ